MLVHVRSGALVAAVVLLGISWSFTLVHVKTGLYPVFWSAAMPLLAVYYASGAFKSGRRMYVPAFALAGYALVLWQVVHGYGMMGRLSAVAAILVSMAVVGAMRFVSRRTEHATMAASVRSRRRAASRRTAPAHR